jgi:ribonucleoside-diphosphate reductase alpha chain
MSKTKAEFFVVKRSGKHEKVYFDKITSRIERLCYNLNMDFIEPIKVSVKVIDGMFSGIKTVELDTLAAETCAVLGTTHPDYNILAARIFVSNLHKETNKDFSSVIHDLYNNTDNNGIHSPLINDRVYKQVMENKDALNSMIIHNRDYSFTFFGLKTLEKAYLLKVKDKVIERPQHLLLRVAVALHGNDLERVLETYDSMSQKYFIHATPTLFNAGTTREGLSSCFLLAATKEDDSIENIYKLLGECACISKYSGGIGISIHDIRAKGSVIHSTNGKSEGIIPMLGVFNKSARYVTQASKRPGSMAIYLEPWHPEIEEFLQLKEPNGTEELRARDLFYALWIPDLFMKRVKNKEKWSYFCPNECPGLAETFGDEFEELYTSYETRKMYKKQVDASDLFYKIMISQIRTGVPYMCYKDNANLKNNQSNLGTLRNSNLCVAPETRILTSKGYFTISELKDQEVEVWNGKEFSTTVVRQTSDDSELIKISFSNGTVLECTEYHKFYIQKGYNKNKITMKEAKDLKLGDNLAKSEFPTIYQGSSEFKYPYTAGFFAGDGTYGNNKSEEAHKQCEYQKKNDTDYCMRHQTFYGQSSDTILVFDNDKCQAIVNYRTPQLALYGEKKKLLDHIDKRYHYGNVSNGSEIIVCQLPFNLPDKYDVPINCNLNIKLRYFEGLCDADGCSVISEINTTSIQIASVNPEYLENVKLMLQTIGVDAKVVHGRDNGTSLLPNGKGEYQKYNTKKVMRLLITSPQVDHLVQIGFAPKRLIITDVVSRKEAKRYIKVTKIEHTGRRDKTFCFNEPLEHKGIFNGIVTGNCSEIMQYSDHNETAVCNLASLGLPVYISHNDNNVPYFDFDLLYVKTKIVTKNLDRVIDVTHYPDEKTRRSNMRHRPLGLGVQGITDCFMILGYPFDSADARKLNKEIFETIYYAALEASCELAQEFGPYESYQGSEFSKGKFQWDLWVEQGSEVVHSGKYDWESLRTRMKQFGMRNSMLTTVMPTASSSQILGNSECIEPLNSNIYKRQTLSGEFMMVNQYLMKDLCDLGIWNQDLKNKILVNQGSVQGIEEIPQKLQDLYKISWDISPKILIDLSADRGPYIDQSQSLNLFLKSPTFPELSKSHFYGWKSGLKTGMYYLRSKAGASAIQYSVTTPKETSPIFSDNTPVQSCRIDDPNCLSCSA